jgi:hypothetical protein
MAHRPLDRRDFNKLTTAALGGLAAGSILGCSSEPAPGPGVSLTPTRGPEIHLCRGLNECKGQGKGGENACRGQGECATAKESACGGQNECKGLGGCGETVGANECKGQGLCHVPLMEGAWNTLHDRKKAEWEEKKLEFGEARAKGGSLSGLGVQGSELIMGYF